MKPVIVVSQPGRQTLHIVLEDALVVGRECEGLLLADAQTSRRHLELRARDGQVTCTDLGSTNGTFINNIRIKEECLVDGDVVRFGTLSVVFKCYHDSR